MLSCGCVTGGVLYESIRTSGVSLAAMHVRQGVELWTTVWLCIVCAKQTPASASVTLFASAGFISAVTWELSRALLGAWVLTRPPAQHVNRHAPRLTHYWDGVPCCVCSAARPAGALRGTWTGAAAWQYTHRPTGKESVQGSGCVEVGPLLASRFDGCVFWHICRYVATSLSSALLAWF